MMSDSTNYFDNVSSEKDSALNDCFISFDQDRDGKLSVSEFGDVCRSLFRDSSGKPYILEAKKLAHMFHIFDKNQDGFIDGTEFEVCWNQWIKVVTRPNIGLIIVDVQNDFISGTLAVSQCPAGHNGEEVVPVINKLLSEVHFSTVVYSMDWHPVDHLSFLDNVSKHTMHSSSKFSPEAAQMYDTVVFEGDPVKEQVLWPRHCVQESWGAELHPDLKVVDNAVWIKKGHDASIDSYSAFFDNAKRSDTGLSRLLRQHGVTDVFVCGIATDICVAATALHSLDEGFRTVCVDDACRGVNPCDIDTFQKDFVDRNGLIITSDKVADMCKGVDRHPVLGYSLALSLS